MSSRSYSQSFQKSVIFSAIRMDILAELIWIVIPNIDRYGKKRKVQGANSEGLLRIIQSIPSPKTEPFKRWLAKVGSERLDLK